MTITVDGLRAAILRVSHEMVFQHDRLNALDGQLGDGDLGITLVKAFRTLEAISKDLPDDVGLALGQAASAVVKVSSSSFGTLMATGMLAAGKSVRGQTEIDDTLVSAMLDAALQAMMQRGKSALGDKTVLDSLSAVVVAMDGSKDPASSAAEAAERALAEFRNKPNRIGRARMFGDKTIGMDDPGMVAFKAMVDAIARR